MKHKVIISILLISFSASIYADTKLYNYLGKMNAFNFNNETLIVMENLYIKPPISKVFIPGKKQERILFINFKEMSAKEIESSRKSLWPLLVDHSQKTILYNHKEKSQSILYDVPKNKVLMTINSELWKARVLENNGTQFWFKQLSDGKEKLYDISKQKYITIKEPPKRKLSNKKHELKRIASTGGHTAAPIWLLTNKKSNKVTKYPEPSSNYPVSDAIWNPDGTSVWLFPSTHLLNIKSKAVVKLNENWRDVSYNNEQVLVYDTKLNLFRTVSAFTGKVIKTYQPFWQKGRN